MPPTGESYHTAVWTGHEMIVWGGYGGQLLNTGEIQPRHEQLDSYQHRQRARGPTSYTRSGAVVK